MPTLIAAFHDIWNEGHDTALLEGGGIEVAGNPYSPEDYPDWPRQASIE